MISFAQNHEDVLLDRAFPRGHAGFYIDVGAYDPTHNSVTRHFYDLGWRGINVEPSTVPFERLAATREHDVNLNAGLSDDEGKLTFFESPPDSGWSTFNAEQAERHRQSGLVLVERTVPVTTLARVCEEHVEGTIDFLTVDVEGLEAEVLRGGDWKRWRPRVVLVEATEPGTRIPSHEAWEPILLEADYVFAFFDGLNRYYVRSEDSDLLEPLRVPVNILDDYVPYEIANRLEHARLAAAAAEHDLAAARALNQAYTAESKAFANHIAFLHGEYKSLSAQYRDIEGAFYAGQKQYEVVRGIVAELRSRYEQLSHDLVANHAEFANTLGGISPSGLSAGRRLTQLAARFPGPAAAAKRSARAAVALKRRLPGRPG